MKKTPPKRSQSENTNNQYSHGSGVTNGRNSTAPPSASNSAPPIPAKRGGGGGMLEELSNRFGSLKSVPAAEKTTPPPSKTSPTSRYQPPQKVDNSTATGTTIARMYSNESKMESKKSSSTDRSDSERLDAIDKKLDKIMAHLGILSESRLV